MLVALHAPDGFLEPRIAVITAVLSLSIVAVAVRRAGAELGDRQVPTAGIAAAFIFAAQMVNFPIASGTTGHLLGGALAAILLGPWIGSMVVSVVVVVQALVFADGGLTALGYNTLNMAIVAALGGWALFQLFRRLLPANASGVVAATALASGVSVVLSATMFSLEWLFGASAPVPFDTVFSAMVGVHLLIGVGEGLISGLVVGAVLAARPDLVAGVRDIEPARLTNRTPVAVRTVAIGGIVAALFCAAVISQFAATAPDGLESVAAAEGFAAEPGNASLRDTLLADYAVSGIDNEALSLAIAGIAGVILTLVIGYGLVSASRHSRRSLGL